MVFLKKCGNLLLQFAHLSFEVRCVVDDSQVPVPGPAGKQPVIQRDGLFHRLIAGGVIGVGIKRFRTIRCCHEMKHGIITVTPVDDVAIQGT